jgi:hypothetical protein
MSLGATIEFKTYNTNSDFQDLSQECTAYMKTKQFMAKRIFQQQEEIEALKLSVLYHSAKHLQLYELIKSLLEQIEAFKKNKNEMIINDELVNSFVMNDDDSKEFGCLSYEHIDKNMNEIILKKENLEMCKDIERLNVILLEKTLEINKLTSDKFILFNELNELVMSMRKVDLSELNAFYKEHTKMFNFSKLEMPCTKGIKYNILSSQNQLIKIIKGDLIKKKLNSAEPNADTIHLDNYMNILNGMEDDFDKLLDKKLSKKPKNNV